MGKPKESIPVKGSKERNGETNDQDTSRFCTFKDAVLKCDEIKDALRSGLSALRANSKVVKPRDTKLLEGSVDIDEAVKALRPGESRWDYVVGYSNEAFFIEVHPAGSSNVERDGQKS